MYSGDVFDLKFTKHYDSYNTGEVAGGYRAVDALALIKAKVAEPATKDVAARLREALLKAEPPRDPPKPPAAAGAPASPKPERKCHACKAEYDSIKSGIYVPCGHPVPNLEEAATQLFEDMKRELPPKPGAEPTSVTTGFKRE